MFWILVYRSSLTTKQWNYKQIFIPLVGTMHLSVSIFTEFNLFIGTSIEIFRSSHRRFSVKKGVLRNFTKFMGKHLCQSLFFNKVAGLRPETSFKKRPWHRCFPVSFEISKNTFFTEHLSVTGHVNRSQNYLFHNFSLTRSRGSFALKVLCYLQIFKNTKYVRIVLNHFWWLIKPISSAKKWGFCDGTAFCYLT